ncbi:MAG: hypothetical protein Q7R34_06945 [Dehalococcoidia bacterium]|nr:hypothetical protein [Dehalococcoidia bacterium]
MPTREEMHSLTQGIISSYEARLVDVASIREATQDRLRELDMAHQAMARQQRTDLSKGRSDLASSVASQLKELDVTHQVMAHQQRADLAKGRVALTRGEAGRKSGVNAWMKVVATAHAAAHDEWQKLAAAMRAKKGVPAAGKKAGAEVGTEFGDLRDKVFAYLADHPDGARMTELEKVFGVARIQMAKVVKHMTDENKVAKRDLVYFAI